jgi:ABC-type dipeptide/oligopeptide/nickel transport system ATPase subunit
MNAQLQRTFEDKPAVREATPLLVGLFGPSGGGKTFSGLRIATGIQRITGGDIYGIDTESRRMLHYADKFKFRHLQFGAPFGSLDYLSAVEHCVKKGAKVILVDSMSHEHEGPGGVLEQHAAETKRLAELWGVKESKAQIAAWSAPKAARRRMINTLLQINANFIFCFRAKDKLKIVSGKDPVDMGTMPICGEEFFFEMTLSCLLMPMNKGVPTWQSEYPGEKALMNLPGQFEEMFGRPRQLDEDTGEALARWSAGTVATAGLPEPDVEKYVELMANCETLDALVAAFKSADDAARKARDQKARDRFAGVKDQMKAVLAKGE